ncbi:MAG TPA: hypothetical protein VM598_03725 [Bdellovibrionota bacterium]|nr:hypothetical protein [Bdellovibrionota bacterium]
MWRWLSMLTAVATLSLSTASAVDTSRGQTSEEEGRVLWKDGRAAAEEGRCADAVAPLSRLVDRYPGHEGYIRAHLLLGECLLALGDAKAALKPLRYFVSGSANETRPEARELFGRGRASLARAYLAAGRFQEAFLTAEEILKRSPGAEGMLLKARAQIGLGQLERAEKSLGDARRGVTATSSAALRGEAAWTRMRLETRHCEKLPARGKMDEAQARNQIERRGNCLLGAALHAREAIASGDPEWSRLAEAEAREASSSFRAACSNPPDPLPLRKGRRTAVEVLKYRSELADVFARDCAAKLTSAIGMVEGWSKELPAKAAPYLGGIRDALKGELERLGKERRAEG